MWPPANATFGRTSLPHGEDGNVLRFFGVLPRAFFDDVEVEVRRAQRRRSNRGCEPSAP
jgi:hypothetical protein